MIRLKDVRPDLEEEMPLPKPRSGEGEKEFISRCMKDFPDEGITQTVDQQVAICHSQWEKEHGKTKMMDDFAARDTKII